MLEEELPCVRYDGWGNLTPSGYFKFDLGVCTCASCPFSPTTAATDEV